MIKRNTIFAFVMMVFTMGIFAQSTKKNITFKSLDGLLITADLYQIENKNAPYIILYHQARYSRGEYLEIAPKLNEMGFNCLAIDQRSGDQINGIVNETYQRALKKELATKYPDAWPDLQATIHYVRDHLKAKKIIAWGSSYSAALVFVLGSDYASLVDGVLAFSPGEYFEIHKKTISEYAKTVSCPVFITSSKSEEGYWRPIYDNLNTTNKAYFLPKDEGFHGSKALWEENEGYEEYWKAVKNFLESMK